MSRQRGGGIPPFGAPLALIVAEVFDEGSAAVAQATTLRTSVDQVALVTPADLALASWAHRVDASGAASTVVDLPDGRRFSDGQIGAVLFRAGSIPIPRFLNSKASDRDYAASELQALVVSWLRSLGDKVINCVDGVCPMGPSWSSRRWLAEARLAGLPVVTSVTATSARLVPGWLGSPFDARRPFESRGGKIVQEILVAGEVAVGELSERFGDSCRRLAAHSRCRVLQTNFCQVAGELAVTSVLPVPPFVSTSQVEVVSDLLTHVLRSHRAG